MTDDVNDHELEVSGSLSNALKDSSSTLFKLRHPESNAMHHSNSELQELLQLAAACVKCERLPGELTERDFFDRFEQEDAQAKARAESAAAKLAERFGQSLELEDTLRAEVHNESTPPICPPTPEGMSDKAVVAKLKRDVQQIERLVAERRQELDSENAAINRQVLRRCKAEDTLGTATNEVRKLRKDIRQLRFLYAKQTREIEELDLFLDKHAQSALPRKPRNRYSVGLPRPIVKISEVPPEPVLATECDSVSPDSKPSSSDTMGRSRSAMSREDALLQVPQSNLAEVSVTCSESEDVMTDARRRQISKLMVSLGMKSPKIQAYDSVLMKKPHWKVFIAG